MPIDDVQDITPINQYVAGAGQTLFDYDFPIYLDGDIVVYKNSTLQALGTNYTVAGEGTDTGGTFTFLVALAGGEVITAYRDLPINRTADFQQNGPWGSDSTNTEFDRIIMMLQQLERDLGRALHISILDPVANTTQLPATAARAGKFLAFDANGDPIASAGTGNDSALRTDLAATTAGNDGSRLSGFRRTEAGASARTVYSKLQEILSATDFGAIGDGVTNNDVAFDAWIEAAKLKTAPVMVLPDGDYLINSTAIFDLPDYSTVHFNGRIRTAAAGVQLGSASANSFGLTIYGLDVRRTTYDTASGGSVGVHIQNVVASEIHVKACSGFDAGVRLNGTQANGGVSHNHVHLGRIIDNRFNLILTASGAGFCNENLFFGGHFDYSSTWLAAAGNYNGTFDILEDNFPTSPLNGNKFYGPSLQSGGTATVGAQIHGQNTHLYDCRLESGSGTPADFKIVFTANSTDCRLTTQSGALLVNITDTGTANSYWTMDGAIVRNRAPTGAAILSARATAYGDGLTRCFEARDTAAVARFFATADGLVRCTRLTVTDALTVPEITANQNDYNPTGLATAGVLRLHSNASRNITGLAGGAGGREMRCFNVGGFDIVLTNADAASAAANRFLFGANITINPAEGIVLWYDIVNTGWRAYGKHV